MIPFKPAPDQPISPLWPITVRLSPVSVAWGSLVIYSCASLSPNPGFLPLPPCAFLASSDMTRMPHLIARFSSPSSTSSALQSTPTTVSSHHPLQSPNPLFVIYISPFSDSPHGHPCPPIFPRPCTSAALNHLTPRISDSLTSLQRVLTNNTCFGCVSYEELLLLRLIFFSSFRLRCLFRGRLYPFI